MIRAGLKFVCQFCLYNENHRDRFPLSNTISNSKYQTTHLDTVRLLDSKHFAVLLRCCDSHHIRRVVLRNENSSSPKIGYSTPRAFHCRLIERSRWITGITMIYFSYRQSRTTEEIFFSTAYSFPKRAE